MPTTIHIPVDLLEQIDRRAHSLEISRNRYIVETLRRELADRNEWPAEFLDEIRGWSLRDGGAGAAVEEMLAGILSNRRSGRGSPLSLRARHDGGQ